MDCNFTLFENFSIKILTYNKDKHKNEKVETLNEPKKKKVKSNNTNESKTLEAPIENDLPNTEFLIDDSLFELLNDNIPESNNDEPLFIEDWNSFLNIIIEESDKKKVRKLINFEPFLKENYIEMDKLDFKSFLQLDYQILKDIKVDYIQSL